MINPLNLYNMDTHRVDINRVLSKNKFGDETTQSITNFPCTIITPTNNSNDVLKVEIYSRRELLPNDEIIYEGKKYHINLIPSNKFGSFSYYKGELVGKL